MSRRAKSIFNPDWIKEEINPQWSKVFTSVNNDVFKTFCKICQKSIDLSNMGRQALTSHEKSLKHKKIIQACQRTTTINFPIVLNTNDTSSNNNNDILNRCSLTQNQSIISKFVFDAQVIDAEILWCLTIIATNMSYNSCVLSVPAIKLMFPDSNIAQSMSLGYTKAAYVTSYGLAPYFKEILDEDLQKCDNYVICFDEALNKIAQSGQMDIHIRFFNNNKVETRFFTSVFMKYTTAEDILKYFLSGVKSLHIERILQISMDGPNVNWKFLSHLKEHRSLSTEKKILEIGTCGLHIIHGAFQAGHKECNWHLNDFLRGIYYLFKDSPKRRADFQALTKCNTFPKKFCVTRWVETADAAKRAIDLVDHLNIYIKNKNIKLPSNISISHVKKGLDDKQIKAKLAFFELIASLLQPFLTKYQTQQPLLPFMYDDLDCLLRNLISRFIKIDIENLSTDKLLHLNYNDQGIYKKLTKIDIGFRTKNLLSVKDISEKDKILFFKDCQKFLRKCVTKLTERCGLKYGLVKAVTALNPNKMALSATISSNNFTNLLEILYNNNIISSSSAELAKLEYSKFLMQFRAIISGYGGERLDTYFSALLNGNSDFYNMWDIFKLILIMSHGNASVESGFSINKNLLIENLHEETLVNQRIVFDVIKNSGGIEKVAITDKLRRNVRSSYSKYKVSLENKKKQNEHETEKDKLKRQAKTEILNLENKKKKIELTAEKEALLIKKEINDLRKYL